MPGQGSSTPSVTVNDTTVFILPNTLETEPGGGEDSVRIVHNGSSVDTVTTRNLEESFAMVKFSVANTPENFKLIRGWKNLDSVNISVLAGPNSDSYPSMKLTSRITEQHTADGAVELEFKGPPII